MIKKSKIYLGTIKKCLNAARFKEYGETRFIPQDRICSVVSGVSVSYADTYANEAVLLKGSNDKYINVNEIKSIKDLVLFKLGLSGKIMHSSPESDEELFVDESSLKQYYKPTQGGQKIKLKTLKKELY